MYFCPAHAELSDRTDLAVTDWREPLRSEAHGRGLGNYRVLACIVTITFVALYAVFR